MSKLNLRICAIVTLTVSLSFSGMTLQSANAATRTWDGANGTNWSSGGGSGNWSGAAIPGSGDIALFNEQGEAGATSTLTNTVDAAFPETAGVSTIQGLQYLINTDTTPEFYHRTEITAGRTLLATDLWEVNRSTGTLSSTINLEIAGGAGSKFQVGNTGATTAVVDLGNHTSTNDHVGMNIDMTGLESFEANVNTFHAASTSQPVPLNLQLAQSNYLRGNEFEFARATGNNPNHVRIYLGQTNTLEFDDILIAVGKTQGTIEFNTGLTNPDVTIRGTAGGASRADVFLGENLQSTGGGTNATLDVSAGTIDALIDTFRIGSGAIGGTPNGTFTMSAGSVDANSLVAASSDVNSHATATLNIQGGTFSAASAVLAARTVSTSSRNSNATLNISGGDVTFGTLLMGDNLGGNGTANGIINLSAGSLTAGSITKGAGTATLNFTGGRLTTDSINFDLLQQGGTLAVETGSTNVTGDYTLQAPGTLEVTLTNTLSPALIVSGSVTLAGELDVYAMDVDLSNPVSTIDIITAGSVTGEFSNAANGSMLEMNGLMFGISYSGTTVTLTNVIQPVPEPASLSLLGLGLLFVVRKRRRGKKS